MNKKTLYLFGGLLLLAVATYILYSKYTENKIAQEQQKIYEEAHNTIQDTWKNKTLKFPVELYNSMTNEKIDIVTEIQKSSKEYTLISYLDGDCSTCVNDLKKWKTTLTAHPFLEEKLNIQFIIISGDIELLKYQVYDQAKSTFDFLWDKKNQFKPSNKISDLKAYQTFLIKDNKIIFVGSPIRGEFYIEKIKDIIAN